MNEEKALTTELLDLNDDCLYCIFKKLSIKDQLQLVNTCQHFRLIVCQMIWRKEFRKLRTLDSYTAELNNHEYQQVFHHILDYLEEFTIADNKHLVFSSYLGRYIDRPELTFYLCSHFPRLTRLECLDRRIHDGLMRLIVENCPRLEVLKLTSDYVTGAYIKDMPNLHELYLPGCSLSSEHLRDIFKHLKITHLDVSDCSTNLPIDKQTWSELSFLKISENQLVADFVKKFSYLRALKCLTVPIEGKGNLFADWTGLFESFGYIIATMNLYNLEATYVMSAIASHSNQLRALQKISIMADTTNNLHNLVSLPVLKKFHIHTFYEPKMSNVANFIAKAKYLEYLEMTWDRFNYDTFDMNSDWILGVIQNLRQQKDRPNLCLNVVQSDYRQKLGRKIKSLLMREQQNTSQPLLEVTFNMPPVIRKFNSDQCIKLNFNRT